MNKLMMTVAATMSFAAFAQEPAAPAPAVAVPPTPEARMNRPMRPQMMGQGAFDPLMRAVSNPRFAEQLGLSDEQKAKLAAFKGERPESRELQMKVRAAMERQTQLLQAEKIDEAAVMASIDEVFEARKEITKAQMKRMIEMRAILTPEQIKKAMEVLKGTRGARPRGNGPKDRGPAVEAPKAEAPKAEAPAAK